MATPLPIANGFYQSESLPVSNQDCVNWYVNRPQAPALSQEVLFGTPGISLQDSSGDDASERNRGFHTFAGIPYCVNGVKLYRVDQTIDDNTETFSLDEVGEVEGEGRVSIADNGTQMCILIPGGKGYIFTTDPDTITEITDPDFRANGEPQYVVFIDGYFVFTTDSKKFIISALNDGLSYNALDFGTAEADPDDIVAPIVFKNQLFIGGSETIEAFQNIGGAGFPFQRTGLFLDKGITSPFSIVNSEDTFMWIGAGKNESPAIWAFAGNSTTKVSTTAIDSILQRFTEEQLQESFALSYAQRGAYFVTFSLGDETTLQINTITGLWNEIQSDILNALGNRETIRWRVNSLTQAYGKIFVGDNQDGRIGILDPDVYKEYERLILRRISTQPFQNQMDRFSLPMIELVCESGVGDSETEDPQIRMSRSLDGKTFRQERRRSLGKVGEYEVRQIWRKNGKASRFEILRWDMSEPVKPVIIACYADIVQGWK